MIRLFKMDSGFASTLAAYFADGLFTRVAPAWLKPHILVMGAVFAGALAVGYLVLPGDGERIAALERDGRNRQALQILEQRFAQGDRSHRPRFGMNGLIRSPKVM